MLPPGRRRASAIAPIQSWIALFFLFLSTANAATAVLGLDFGTLNLKAVLVKPGIPFEIVLTKDSKRKEAAAVAFKPQFDAKKNIIAEVGTFPERTYGGDALALQGRLPGEVFPNLKPLLGLLYNDGGSAVLDEYKSKYPAVQATQGQEQGTVLVKSAAFADSELPWSVEELLAMQLANVKQNAESLAGRGDVEDVVITVPAFYTADERRAIQTAAGLAGLDVNALISDGLAVGLDYAKSRTFPEVTKGEKPEHHLVFDMGAGSTTATVLRFQSKSVKDVGRFNKTVQEVAVLGTGWDRTLGGDHLSNLVMTDYIQKFAAKPEIQSKGIDATTVRKNARAMSRLWKDADKARQVLSANTETSSSFEELLPDVDFRVKLTRSEFEQIVAECADRVATPINDALAAAVLDMADIDSIILHGGTVRTPFVQRKLEQIAGSSAKLKSNVNADESAVFGAAFKAAGLSPSFKVKEIRDSDVAGYAIGMVYTDGEKERKQVLFSTTSPVGNGATTKQVTFKDKDDFAFSLFQKVDDIERGVSRIQTSNLTASVKALKDKFGCEKDEISTKFSIKLSATDGLPAVLGGSVSCEVEGSGKAESIGDSVKGWLGLGKKNQEPTDDESEDTGPIEQVEANNTTSAVEQDTATTSSGSASTSSSKVPEKPKKRTETIQVAFTTSAEGNPQPNLDEVKGMRLRLAAFDRSDRNRFAREEALNLLESFTYYVRDFLSNADYTSFSTKAQRDEISKLLAATRDFMEDHKAVAQAAEEIFRDKLKDLKSLVEPIQARRKEDGTRSEKVEGLKKDLTKVEKLITKVRDQISSASSKVASISESAAKAATEEPTTITTASSESSSSTISDDLEDLEEPDTSSSTSTTTTTTAPPKPSTFRDFSPYTDDDLTRLSETWEAAKAWLSEQEAAQAKLELHDDPVLLVADIAEQSKTLSAIVREMAFKKNQPPPRGSTSRTKKSTTKTKKAKKSSSTESAADDASAPTSVEGEEPAVVTEIPVEKIPVDDAETSPEEEGLKRDEL